MSEDERMAQDNEEYIWCSGCYTMFHPEFGVRASDEELYCSEECAADADFDINRDDSVGETGGKE